MAALRLRNRTGQGCYIDLSQRELVTGLIGEYVLQRGAGRPLPSLMGQRPAWPGAQRLLPLQWR
jgi:crotonobetainyl-CoA:carnitine CoA-transferase CaiB-like acyl-CoA transferase